MVEDDIFDFDESCYQEDLEYHYYRLMGMAEAFTGAEKLRQLPICSESVYKLYKFIQQEQEMRDLTPQKIEEIAKKVRFLADKDDWRTGGPMKDYKELNEER